MDGKHGQVAASGSMHERRSEAPDGAAVEWRQLGRYLWVGEADGNHLGIIEHGRGFVAIDDTGAVRGRVKTLHEAQRLLDDASRFAD